MSCLNKISLLIFLFVFAGCASRSFDVAGEGTQLEIRQLQTREYDTPDKTMAMRSVIATLQDLNFRIDEADVTLGTITATRPYAIGIYNLSMSMTVTVEELDVRRVSVHANARIAGYNVTKTNTYEDFFAALDKAMFLTTNYVDL